MRRKTSPTIAWICFAVFIVTPRYATGRSCSLGAVGDGALGVIGRSQRDGAGVDIDRPVRANGYLHGIERTRRRSEDSDAGGSIGRPVAGAAEPARRAL